MTAMRVFGMMMAGAVLLGGCLSQAQHNVEEAANAQTTPGIAQTVTPPEAQNAEHAMKCDAEVVKDVVGKAYTEALGEDARVQSGSRSLRVMRPGQAMTMDYRIDRLNLELDASGKVTSARCG